MGFRHVLNQLRHIFVAESTALLGKTPTAPEIAQATKSLKKWKHLGCILDHTHFGRNGMMSGAAIAQLASIAVAADSSHTSIFLPRPLSESEKDILKGMISRSVDKLLNLDAKVAPQLQFYDSVYKTLSNESYEAGWLSRISQMAQIRKLQLSQTSSVQPTSWGITGSHLTKLTDFEQSFTSLLTRPLLRDNDKHKNQDFEAVALSPPSHRITFISPLDGKPAIFRAANLLTKAVKLGCISEEDIDQSIIHALLNSPEGEMWPSPDLVINFKDAPSTSGYPLWHLRYAEIVNAGPLGTGTPLIWKQFHHSLKAFSKTIQRFGK
jgi:hypothetical protein